MNTVQIIGNLTRDPQIRATRNGKTVASFSVAVNRTYTAQDGTEKEAADFINVTAWGNWAEAVGNELRKGSRVYVEGRYSTRTYEVNGEKRYMTEVMANFIAKPIGAKPQGQPNPHAFDHFGAPPSPQYSQGSFDENIPF